VANPAVTKIKAAKDEFFRFLNDLQHNGTEKSNHARHGSAKNFSVEYYSDIHIYELPPGDPTGSARCSRYLLHPACRYQRTLEQPPDNA
jgi:hypothetical protein